MANNERIRVNNTELQECIDIAESRRQINRGTCTVKIVPFSNQNYYVACEQVSSIGAVTYSMAKHYTKSAITKTVRCDSVLVVMCGSVQSAEATDGEILKLTSGQGVVYKTPSTAGVTAQITLSS